MAQSLPPTSVKFVLTLVSRWPWPGPGMRRATPNPGGMFVDDEAAAKPFRFAVAQPQAVRHACAREPVMAFEPDRVRLVDGIRADPEEAPVQRFRDATNHLEIEGRDLVHEGRKVPCDIGCAGAVGGGDVFGFQVHDRLLVRPCEFSECGQNRRNVVSSGGAAAQPFCPGLPRRTGPRRHRRCRLRLR